MGGRGLPFSFSIATPMERQRYFGSTAIDGTMNASQIALAALRKQFAAMLDNEDGTIEGEDPEKLHDMRVAIRRMRAAYGTFRRWMPDELALFAEDLKWIGASLGRVRDLDVQIEHQRQWAEDLGSGDALQPWFSLVCAVREERRKVLVADLRSSRYAGFVESMGKSLLHAEPKAGAPSILVAAPSLIRKRWRKLKGAMSAVGESSPDELLHEVRILAKRFRYSVEFVAPVFGPAAKEVSTSVAKLQDVLGLHQDCSVAEQMVRERLDQTERSVCFELGRLVSHASGIKRKQRELAMPTFEAIRQGPWPAFKTLLRSQSDDAPMEPIADQPT